VPAFRAAAEGTSEREAWLAAALLELSDCLQVDEAGYLRTVTRRLAEIVAPAEVGMLATTETGSLTVSTASTSRMYELVSIEARFQEGPCTTCHGTGQQLPPRDLDEVDAQWPRFGPAARQFGFESVRALPIRRNTDQLGAVCILSTGGRPPIGSGLVTVLVDAAAIGLIQQQELRHSRRRADQLQHALQSRILIEQAKGIVAERRGISPDDAFEHLRGHARRNGRRLNDVADGVVTGRLGDHELKDGRDPGRSRGSDRALDRPRPTSRSE
jgi:ANTAR domain